MKYCERCKKKTTKLEKYLGMIVCRDCVEELKPKDINTDPEYRKKLQEEQDAKLKGKWKK